MLKVYVFLTAQQKMGALLVLVMVEVLLSPSLFFSRVVFGGDKGQTLP